MKNQIALEAAEILKRLSPQNQAYFMTMVRLAEVAERNVKASMRRPNLSQRPEHPAGEDKNQCAIF